MAVIRLDKIDGKHLESVTHTVDLTNGLFVQLGDLVDGETELYKAKVATVDADLDDEFLLVSTPEVTADARKYGLKNFINVAGDEIRVHHLVKGDVITLTGDLIDGTPVEKQFAVGQLGSMKLEASADGKTLLTDGTTEHSPSLVFKVIQVTTLGYDNASAYRMRVIKA